MNDKTTERVGGVIYLNSSKKIKKVTISLKNKGDIIRPLFYVNHYAVNVYPGYYVCDGIITLCFYVNDVRS